VGCELPGGGCAHFATTAQTYTCPHRTRRAFCTEEKFDLFCRMGCLAMAYRCVQKAVQGVMCVLLSATIF
jgi:hypothetical protein